MGTASSGTTRSAAAAVLVAAALLFHIGLGRIDLWAPDEPRFALVAEELRSMRHGTVGLAVLHLNGEVYTQKPPLYYWAAAALGSLTGHTSELAARLPSSLAGVAAIGLTLVLGRALFGSSAAAGLWAAALLATVYRFAHLARRAQLDVLLTVFEVAALLAFWLLERGRVDQSCAASSDRARRKWLFALHLSLGLAVLTKGPVGLLPLATIAAYLAWEGRLRDFRALVPLWGLALSLAPALLWIGAAVLLTPAGFFADAVVENLAGRFFAGTSHARPLYYYLYQLPADFLPWALLWPLAGLYAVRGLRSSDEGIRAPLRLLSAWFLTFLLFFSLSAGKRGLYLLPAFPALALICGAALDAAISRRAVLPSWLARSLTALAVAIAAIAGIGLVTPETSLPEIPSFRIPRSFSAVVLAICASLLAYAWRRPPREQAIAVIAAVAAIELATFTLLYPSFDSQKSPRPIAEQAQIVAGKGGAIGVFRNRALVAGIAYYADAEVVELSDSVDEHVVSALRRFVAAGGRTVIARERDVPGLLEIAPGDIRASLREGERRVQIVQLSETAGADRSP
jgi:4-amino-4-deoxy-L-arabinose transferase-like glycosyltransferase